MGRTTEASLVAVFAAAITVPTAAVFAYAFIEPEALGAYAGIMAGFVLTGMISAFVAARLILRRADLDTYQAGLELGLWSALGFYLVWIIIFAVIPAIGAASNGHPEKAAGYFAEFVWIILTVSRGVPIIVGVAGGLAYIALKRRMSLQGE